MQYREDGLQTIYDRIYASRVTLGLQGFKRSPTKPIDEGFLPCIFMVEDIDEIIGYSARGSTGYPCKRMLEVVLEMITDRDTNIKQLYTDVRSVVFDGGVVVADGNTFIREIYGEIYKLSGKSSIFKKQNTLWS